MGYIEDNLLPNEAIKYLAKLHWIIFLGPFISFLFSLLLFSGGRESAQAGIGFFVISIVYGLLRFITFSTSEFGITNKRIVIKVGFIRRKTLELLLQKVETVGVKQGIIGRVLNYGNIVVVGTGSTREPFKRIANPLEFRKKVLNEIGNITEVRLDKS